MSTAFERGRAAYAEDRFEDAEREFRQAIVDEPQRARAHANLGHVLSVLDRTDEAIVHSRRARELDSQDPKIAELLSAALAAHAWTLIERDQFADAEALAREALALEEHWRAFSVLASSLALRDRWQESRAAMDQALRLEPDDEDLRDRSAKIDEGVAHIEAVLAALDKDIAADPDDPHPVLAKADFLFRLGRLDESVFLHAQGGAMLRKQKKRKPKKSKPKKSKPKKSKPKKSKPKKSKPKKK